jgi:hypothetical protein
MFLIENYQNFTTIASQLDLPRIDALGAGNHAPTWYSATSIMPLGSKCKVNRLLYRIYLKKDPLIVELAIPHFAQQTADFVFAP